VTPPRAELLASAGRAPTTDRDPEFELRDGDFERICRLIYQRAGISLSSAKRTMVYSRLARRLRVLGDGDFATYLRRLDRSDAAEWQQFVNALTTNLTSFYREPHHFEILAKHLQKVQGSGKLRIWCCAASSGEEPYTVAFTAIEALGNSHPPLEIIATDIDTQVLTRAQTAIYPLEAVASLSPERVARFFKKGVGQNEGMVRVRPEIAKLVSFSPLNLQEAAWSVGGDFAAIFCRNVMIYFDRPTQLTLLERLTPRLAEDGLLFAGHSENLSYARALLRPLGHTVYCRAGNPDRSTVQN